MVQLTKEWKGLVDADTGTVSREIFWSKDLYDQEMEQVFARSWLFVGHDSQIPNPGDYILGRMGEEAVVVSRDRDSKIHVFLNSCRHRGNRVCRYDQGNSFTPCARSTGGRTTQQAHSPRCRTTRTGTTT